MGFNPGQIDATGRSHAFAPFAETGGKYYQCSGRFSSAGQAPWDLAVEAHGLDGYHPFTFEARARRAWRDAGFIRLTEPSCEAPEPLTPPDPPRAPPDAPRPAPTMTPPDAPPCAPSEPPLAPQSTPPLPPPPAPPPPALSRQALSALSRQARLQPGGMRANGAGADLNALAAVAAVVLGVSAVRTAIRRGRRRIGQYRVAGI